MKPTPEMKAVDVTPEMASEWLLQYRYEHQRNVRPQRVKFLAEEMTRGSFKDDSPIEFTTVDGKTVLTDGQHRLTAVTWAKIPQRFVVITRVVKDEEQLALDYTRTDQVQVRSISDSYKTLSLETELGFTPNQINRLGVAAGLIDRNFGGKKSIKIHPDDRLRLMRNYSEYYGTYLECIAGCRKEYRSRLERGATLAVALVTLRYATKVYSRQKVEDFWNGTAMDDGLKTGDPRKVALRHLMEMGMIGGNSVNAGKSVSPEYSSRALAHCWNKWAKDEKLQYHPREINTGLPILILGSPFDGK